MGVKMLFIGLQDKVIFCSKPGITFLKFDVSENHFEVIEYCCTNCFRKTCPVVRDFIQRLKLETKVR